MVVVDVRFFCFLLNDLTTEGDDFNAAENDDDWLLNFVDDDELESGGKYDDNEMEKLRNGYNVGCLSTLSFG